MTNSHMTLGQLIRHRRETLDLSLRQLGQLIGTTDTTVMRIESGEIKSPRGEVLRALAEALELPSADLFSAAGYTIPSELPSFRPYLQSTATCRPPTLPSWRPPSTTSPGAMAPTARHRAKTNANNKNKTGGTP